MFPDATHDEQARQDFVRAIRSHVMGDMRRTNTYLYKNKLRPAFQEAQSRPPRTRTEVRKLMEKDPFTKMWGSLVRTTQEMLYDTVGPSIERQHPGLVEKAKRFCGRAGGTLRLNSDLEVPAYLRAVDIHCKPGGYHTERGDNDLFAGAEYDRTVNVYLMGQLGPQNDDIALSIIRWLQDNRSAFKPRAILDIGCTVGHSTIPYGRAWPRADLRAIDVAGPCLRYAHARAEGMRRKVHFSQQNAEGTDFPDASFDLVVSHLVLHETSNRAVRNIFRECHRLLRPGGYMLHADGIAHQEDPYDKYMAEWSAHYNNEPFLGTLQDLNLSQVARDAGFVPERIYEMRIPSVHMARPHSLMEKTNGQGRPSDRRPLWYVIGAQKK